MKQWLIIIAILQLLFNGYIYHELKVARLASNNYQAEIQLLRSEVRYLTHPETMQTRMIEYILKVGEFE